MPDEIEFKDIIKRLGFAVWSRIGDPDALAVPLSLTVYAREDPPRFFLEVEGNSEDSIERVYATTLPDVMDLLARWVPTLQAAAVTEVCCQLTKGPHASDDQRVYRGVVELLEALADRGR